MNAIQRKIRIGFFTNNPLWGGSEIYLKRLIEKLDRNRFEVILFLTSHAALRSCASGLKAVQVVVLDEPQGASENGSTPKPPGGKHFLKKIYKNLIPWFIKKQLGFKRDVIRFGKIFERYGIDIMHTNEHSPGLEPAALAAKYARIPKVVCAIHSIAFDAVQSPFENSMNRRTLRTLDCVIFSSKYARDLWVKKYPMAAHKNRVVYNGVEEISGYNPQTLKTELNTGENVFKICVPANFLPIKGHQFLMQAMPAVVKEIPNVIFLFAGDGVCRPEIEALAAEKGLQSYCKFLGYRDDIAAIMSFSDIVVLPSRLENFPLVLLEGMFCKKPLVAARVGGISEIIDHGNNGCLVSFGDTKALSSAIIDLLKHPDKRRSMGENGYRKAKSLFSLNRMVKDMENFYSDSVAEAPGERS